MEDKLRKQVMQRLESLRQDRDEYMDEWRDSADFVLGVIPRSLMNSSGLTSERKLRSRNEYLLNETAQWSLNVMASGMMAGITSPARKWFELTTPDPDLSEYSPVKEWLSEVQRIMMSVYARTNFYQSMNSLYVDLGLYGQGVVTAYEDFNDVVRFTNIPCGSYMLGRNGNGETDRLYAETALTVREAYTKFGYDALSTAHQKMYDDSEWESLIQICHAIEPNDARQSGSPLAKDMPYRSIYYDKDNENHPALRQSGFQTKPFFAPRWFLIGEDTYSTTYPSFSAMGTNKSLQVEEMDKAVAIEKMHNPPLIGDAQLQNGGLDLIAGGVSFAPNMAAMGKPSLQSVYDVNMNISPLLQDIESKERRIKEAYFADLFLMVSNMDRAQITATEIAERKEEKLLMLGTVLERLNNELLDPVIDRTFEICMRKGMFPPPPPELQDGMKLSVEYISVLAQAQKAISTNSIDVTAAFVGQLAQFNPDVLDKVDFDEMVDQYAKAKGTPPSIIRSIDDVAAVRQQRAEAQAAAQQQEQAMMAAQNAKTMSDTKLDENTALDAALQQG